MPLSWKERLQAATYGGVPFLVTSHGHSTGRRASVVEFPQRDTPYVEDLGRSKREYSVEGIILGDDYMDRRDRLLDVCTRRAPGFPHRVGRLLTHPYLGNLNVFCERVEVTETVSEGRMCRVRMDFVETGDTPAPKRAVDSVQAPTQAARETASRAEAVAADSLVVTGPETVREAVAAELRKIGSKLDSLDVFTGPAEEVSLLSKDIERLIGDAVSLAKSPADAAATVRQAIDRVLAAVSRTEDAVFAYRALFDLEADQGGGTGGTGQQADANALRVIEQAKQTSAGGLASALARQEWESRDEALAARSDLVGRLESILDVPDDELQVRLSRMLSLASSTIPPADERLPRLTTLTLQRDTPALVLAYRLYDDVGRDQEIADRNGLRRPGFVPGGVPIEVLTNA